MTTTTVSTRIDLPRHRPLSWPDADIVRDVLRLALVAALVAVGEALSWPVVLLALVGAEPQPAAWAGIAGSGWPFLVITGPVMAVWFVGAVRTREAIRRLGGINACDRAAIAELNRMLAAQ